MQGHDFPDDLSPLQAGGPLRGVHVEPPRDAHPHAALPAGGRADHQLRHDHRLHPGHLRAGAGAVPRRAGDLPATALRRRIAAKCSLGPRPHVSPPYATACFVVIVGHHHVLLGRRSTRCGHGRIRQAPAQGGVLPSCWISRPFVHTLCNTPIALLTRSCDDLVITPSKNASAARNPFHPFDGICADRESWSTRRRMSRTLQEQGER